MPKMGLDELVGVHIVEYDGLTTTGESYYKTDVPMLLVHIGIKRSG